MRVDQEKPACFSDGLLYVPDGPSLTTFHVGASTEFSMPESIPTMKVPIAAIRPIIHKTDKNITHEAIFASSPEGAYGRPFGRDSAIIASFKLAIDEMEPDDEMFARVRSALLHMYPHIAREDVPEARIQRGKMFHEMGTIDQGYPVGWYMDLDGVGKNYDTLDATSRHILVIDTMQRRNPELVDVVTEHVELMTEWEIRNVQEFGGAAYIPAEHDEGRGYPGLYQQRWRDCRFSTVDNKGEMLTSAIYPVEEQALRWASLSAASDMLAEKNPELARQARETAAAVKMAFNKKFVYQDEQGYALADALHGKDQEQIRTVTIDNILALAPSYKGDSIIDDTDVREEIIDRTFRELYTTAGLRTVSPRGIVHPQSRYHGPYSIWPHAQGMAVMMLQQEAERNKGVNEEYYEKNRTRVLQVGQTMLGMLYHFNSPIESVHLTTDGGIELYSEVDGDGAVHTCPTEQTWAGAAGEYVAMLLEKRYGMKEVVIPDFHHNSMPPSGVLYQRTA